MMSLAALFLCATAETAAHDGNLSSVPWDACEDKQRSAICSFTNSEQDIYRGTCQSMSGDLICVRNQPIEHAEDNERVDHSHEHSSQDHHHDDSHADNEEGHIHVAKELSSK